MMVVSEAGKVTISFVDAFKREPLSLALVVMNLALLGFFYFLLTTVAAQREREISLLYMDKAQVRELLGKLAPDLIHPGAMEGEPDFLSMAPAPLLQ